jgi:hypothetical protein
MVTFPPGSCLKRTTGGFLPPVGQSESLLWIRLDASANPRILQVFYTVDRDYTAPYIKIASPPGSPDTIGMEVFDGTTISRSYPYQDLQLQRLKWYPTWIRCTSGVLTLIAHANGNGTSVYFPTGPWTGRSFVSHYLGGDGLSSTTGVSLAVYRAWDYLPASSDPMAFIWSELASLERNWDITLPEPPNTTFVDTALDVDLLDQSVNARHWVAVGSPVVTPGFDWGTISPLAADNTLYSSGFEFGLSLDRPYQSGLHIGTGCGGGNMFGCGSSGLERLFETGGRGFSRGALHLDLQALVPMPQPEGSGTPGLRVLFVYDRNNPSYMVYRPGGGYYNPPPPYSTNLSAVVWGDGSIYLECADGAAGVYPWIATLITATSAPGLVPMDGVTTTGLQFLWDLSGSTLVVQAYVNNVLAVTASGPDRGLVSKTWNYVASYTDRSPSDNASHTGFYTFKSMYSNIAVYPTNVLGNRPGCSGAVPISLAYGCCYPIPVALPTSLTGDIAANKLSIHGSSFLPGAFYVSVQGPEGVFVAYDWDSSTETLIVLKNLNPPLQAGGTYCVTVGNSCR